MSEWLIYGATGYTGELIAREAVRLGLSPVVAGRNALAVESLGKELGLRARVIALDDPATIASNLAGIDLVLNCAGPFSQTAEPMMQACLTRRAHYLDITGEIDVFERAHAHDAAAKAAGIVLCSGVGFDVIPTDCVAAMLKESLPGATPPRARLRRRADALARHREDARREPGVGREDPPGRQDRIGPLRLRDAPHRLRCREDDRDGHSVGRRRDGVLHHRHPERHRLRTGIAVRCVRASDAERAALCVSVRRRYGACSRGASKRRSADRAKARGAAGGTRVWGEARDHLGHVQRIRLKTANPYALTVDGALAVVRRLLGGPAAPGSTTPAKLMGSSFVLDLPGTKLER